MLPKTRERLPIGSDVDVVWPPTEALDYLRRPVGSARRRPNVTHRHDGSSIDLERELVRYMAERRVSRRQLLDADGGGRRNGGAGTGHRGLHR